MRDLFGHVIRQRRQPEHDLQSMCVRWFRLTRHGYTGDLFAVPNGGRRDAVTGARLKEEGVVAGVADLLYLRPSGRWHGLCVEMKARGGHQSPSQRQWQQKVESNGYRYEVCRTFEDFVRIINEYDNDERTTEPVY